MEPTGRQFQCLGCGLQTVICSKCDRGQSYCSNKCSILARRTSLKAAGKRYQATINGKRNHAARQSRYEMKKNNLTHHGSHQHPVCASIKPLENNTKNMKTEHNESSLRCHFCGCKVSLYVRKDFLQRGTAKKPHVLLIVPQAP